MPRWPAEAQRDAPGLRAAGWSYAAIGARYGVSGVTAQRHLDPLFRERQNRSSSRWSQLHPARKAATHNTARDAAR